MQLFGSPSPLCVLLLPPSPLLPLVATHIGKVSVTQELKLSSQLVAVVGVVSCCCRCLLYGFIYFSQVQPLGRLVLGQPSIPIFSSFSRSPYSFSHSLILPLSRSYMFIPCSVLRYKLLFYAIAFVFAFAFAFARGLQLTWPSPSRSLFLSLLFFSPSSSASLLFSLTLLYDYFRQSVAHCRLPLTLNFPAATDPCPMAPASLSVPIPSASCPFLF